MQDDLNPILMIVEDDLVDIEIVTRGIESRKLNYKMFSENDGSQALKFLRQQEFTESQRRNLIVILDINMPGMNGHQFLEELRSDSDLKRTIVFVLTTSDHERDIAQAYDKNVAGYFVKSNVEGLLDTVAVYVENVEFPPTIEIT
jgi:CheY-like chemotaxis protein